MLGMQGGSIEDIEGALANDPTVLREDLCFPLWDNLTLIDDPDVIEEDRVSVAIHRNNLMNPLLKIHKSTIKDMCPDHPWGTFAEENIVPKVVILEYKGEIKARREDSDKDNRYVFSNGDGTFTDGHNPLLSGVARFINATGEGEEGDANCEVCCRDGKLFVDSIKYIHKGSELLYDYGTGYEWKDGEQKSCYTRLTVRRRPKILEHKTKEPETPTPADSK
jgi:hypothetical protein